MPIIHTAKDLGLAIRSRRRALGWDQATLAKQVGVTRQWVIDIEKGKPRAELALAMRAIRVLGLSLNLEAASGSAASRSESDPGGKTHVGTPYLDIKAIVEGNRATAASKLVELAAPSRPQTAVEHLQAVLLSGADAAPDADGSRPDR